MNHIVNHKWRSLAFLFAIVTIPLGYFFLSNAWAKPQRVSPASPAQLAAVRSAQHVEGAAFSFSNPIHLTRPLSTLFIDADGEPEVKVDLHGNIYVTGIRGVPGGVDLWKSTDGGATFAYLGQPDGAQDKCPSLPECAAAGGGDDQIDVSTGGYLYVSSLWLGNVTMSTSYDGGTGGVQAGQKWEVVPNAAGPGAPVVDRQWIAAYGPQTVYLSYASAALTVPPGFIGLFVTKSTDAGKTFGPPTEITTLAATGELGVAGNIVVDPYNGNVYTAWLPSANPANINFSKSTDGGATWTTTTAYTGPAGTTSRGVFPILAVDRGGNVHLVFTNSTLAGHNNCHVFLTSTANPGAASPTWLPAVQVDSGIGDTTSAALPWVVAGSPGVVDITWLGSSATTPDAPNSNWFIFFSQTTNAMSGSPLFNQAQVTTSPIHNHSICFDGGGCAGNGQSPNFEPENREMLEYSPTLALDSQGNVNIAFANSITNCGTGCYTTAWFTKQTDGGSAYLPPAPPAPATFSNLVVPGTGGTAEPNAWADSHNCIFGGSIGGPIAYRSQNAGASFTTKSVVLGAGIHGGDFEIITLPKPDGSRPDLIYTADLGISTVHIGKSIDGGDNYFHPGGPSGAGEVQLESDRMWLAAHRIGANQHIYIMDHSISTEEIRFAALTNDTWTSATMGSGNWSPTTVGSTHPELSLPPSSTYPNTNPGPVFVNPVTHDVLGVFGAATITTNLADPPFGKQPHVWAAIGAPPAAAGAPPGPFMNFPVFKGVIDSPTTPAPPAGSTTYGSHVAAIFPSAAADSAGNVYVVWSTQSARNGTWDIWLASSHDPDGAGPRKAGEEYYGPWRVSSGTGTAVFPWIDAGDEGKVGIVFYQSNSVPPPLLANPSTPGTLTGGPNNMPAGSTWNVMFAQSLNANSREPVFTVSQASGAVNHNGSISIGGLTGSSDRSLLDFFEVKIGPDGRANIMYSDNATTTVRTVYARQTSGPLAVNNPSTVTCLPGPLVPTSIVSRKTHSSAGPFDIELLLPPPGLGIECRVGQGANSNEHQVIFNFSVPVTLSGSPAVTVSGTKGTPGVGSVNVNGAVVTVNLTGIENEQTITVTLNNVNGLGAVSEQMGVLLGDVTANKIVSNTDVAEVKAQVSAPVTASNFRTDVNANGIVSNTDVALTKTVVSTALP